MFESERLPDAGEGDTDEPVDVETVTRVLELLRERGIEHRTVGTRGRPTAAIVDYAAQLEPDTVALGGRKRSPAGKILLGGVTMAVLRNTDIPVVAGSAPMESAGT